MASFLNRMFGSDKRPPRLPLPVYDPPVPGLTIMLISDTHSKHRSVPGVDSGFCDLILHAGDLTNVGTLDEITDFVGWFDDLENFGQKVFIAGNHDISIEKDYYVKRGQSRFHRSLSSAADFDAGAYSDRCREVLKETSPNCTYLEDSSIAIPHPPNSTGHASLLLYGSPWQPAFCDWAFNLDRNGDAIKSRWSAIPLETSILMTHGPPLYYGDCCAFGNYAGCEPLLHEVRDRLKNVRLHVFGHIHEDAGVWFDGRTLFVNASSLNFLYKPGKRPIIVHLPFDSDKPATLIPEEDCQSMEKIQDPEP